MESAIRKEMAYYECIGKYSKPKGPILPKPKEAFDIDKYLNDYVITEEDLQD